MVHDVHSRGQQQAKNLVGATENLCKNLKSLLVNFPYSHCKFFVNFISREVQVCMDHAVPCVLACVSKRVSSFHSFISLSIFLKISLAQP